MECTVVQGDIAEQSAAALVNAAGTSLQMGSGVAGALRQRAHGPIENAAVEQGPVDLGEVAVTDSFGLDANYVIHAAAMPHHGDGQATADSIRSATHNALRKADELGCRSVVLPMLGCGVAGFDLAEGARLLCEEVRDYEPSSLDDVRLIGYSDEEYETIQDAVDEV